MFHHNLGNMFYLFQPPNKQNLSLSFNNQVNQVTRDDSTVCKKFQKHIRRTGLRKNQVPKSWNPMSSQVGFSSTWFQNGPPFDAALATEVVAAVVAPVSQEVDVKKQKSESWM